MAKINPSDPRFQHYQNERIAHWDQVAIKMDHWQSLGKFYSKRLSQIYQFLIPPGKRVLELGSGLGDILADLHPEYGLGIDFSPEMVKRAQQRYPELHFMVGDAHLFEIEQDPFDFILLSDLVNDLWDLQALFERLPRLCHSGTRLIINFYSRLWEFPLFLARRMGLAKPEMTQNWLTRDDVDNLLYLSRFESIRNWHEILLPLPIPLLAPFTNRFIARIWPFNHFSMTNFTLARPAPKQQSEKRVSVIVPARNEAGNVPAIFERVPEMGSGTEMIFVEGNSNDNTYAAIEQAILEHPERNALLFEQTGVGKGDAVRLGFKKATGDILMILDADLTVPPEDLIVFYDALVSGKGEFINGVRLVYPMEQEAMRFLNFLGNKFFSLVFSWLLGQPIKDSLCGTKVLWKKDYDDIVANRSYFGNFDPFGDFDLIFGAAKLNRKIVDLPIRYRERTYGSTNIHRWEHGLLLLRMVVIAANRLKFT